ncbi:acyl-CoA synthetase family protein [Burkholderia cepacia]|uniref:Beta-hydroxyacyl-ACP dehydratase n=1 Tax=Burkholderia cepacia TaxID=292 RepID=A0ABN5CPB9_BURCE|nr:acyl-CoA synthetase family protein [Burkholderia cepacia]AIO24740.1 AMP-binding enzyme family protein [Burkholderia cepacia ATCC 25416]ALK16617.1 beta-hydroxyacyl-ACP dehydratase [Burkholderia cepacia ATCC 25416]ASE94765.1 beta-hydroxyacyl-ACP dehydratase [Burkholderia cepacia]ATF77056.1 beta-hydroxyacyl-ACP dehydratase [Burkholderia cepacia]MCA8468237.1 acyl-CoA synthetase family protein [Burkholderia cepacia]
MPTHPLVFHSSPDQTIAWRDGAPVTVRTFVADVARVAAALPAGAHVFNVCRDRYRFAVSLCAALVAGKVSLLPSTHTPEMVRQLASFAPDAFCLHDAPDCTIDLPRFAYPDAAPGALADDAPFAVPQIDAARIMAYVFTSGSTGAPVPHRKTWGFLVGCVRAAADRLGLLDGHAATLIGTVPAQHMYGFESTVLLALIGGLAFSNRQPFYPVDIRDELDTIPQPRVLVTSPIHLRALLAAGHALPRAALVLSATAPLSEKLACEAEAALDAPLVEIYGSTETGQIATRRTSQGAAWELFPDIRLDARAEPDDDSGPTVWVSGGHVEAPVPMGDALELLGDGRFLLHGRKADLVNIAGKRTSLAYLNHQLNAIPQVLDGVFFMPDEAAAAHDDTRLEPVTRLVALVVAPTLTAAGLQRALRERIDPAFMPRPLVFVDALPRNETGKLPRDVLAALVAQHARPVPVPDPAGTPALGFTIPADHPALPGHFPGHPVVPGVVLLDHAIHALGTALNRPLHAWRLGAAKFLSPVAPGEPLDLAYDAAAGGAIRFTLRAGARDVASGVLSAPPAAQDGAQP